MATIRAVFFDVAHTLLEKPAVMPALHGALVNHGIHVPMRELLTRHRQLMEAIVFPDRTSRDFYVDFNAALVRSLGAVPTPALLDEMFTSCCYRPWAPYADVGAIDRLALPRGVLSNWDTSLAEKLDALLGVSFEWILGSEEQRVRKPDEAFFQLMPACTGMAPEQIAFVGDSMRLDIEPALRMGFRAILLDRDNLFPYSPLARVGSLEQLEQFL